MIQAGNELFAFDPAHNILSDDLNAVTDNRLKTYNGTTYYYDDLGNLIHRELADGEVQNYFYDLHDQLVKAEIFKKDGTKESWCYTYDALGRRIGKGRLKNEEVSETSFPHDLGGNDLENQTRFVWDGSHLLQEVHPDGRYTYIYTDQDSYEPLAQVRDWTTEDGENRQQTHYFHCDQIGIPREMTDKDGNLLWFGNYTGWGRLKEETKVTDAAYQPFRLQNQYADCETGLHYNFFRYYEPDAGRFVNQDPIRLLGGFNLYQLASNVLGWIDPLGLAKNAAKKLIQNLEKTIGSENVHGLRRHGAGTTRAQQRYRARTGVCPDGKRGRPEDSSRFLSPEDQAEAIQIALKKAPENGGPVVFDMGRIVAEGYLKGGRGPLIQTSQVQATFNKAGQLVSIFGKLK